jgi:hypothetical protein
MTTVLWLTDDLALQPDIEHLSSLRPHTYLPPARRRSHLPTGHLRVSFPSTTMPCDSAKGTSDHTQMRAKPCRSSPTND